MDVFESFRWFREKLLELSELVKGWTRWRGLPSAVSKYFVCFLIFTVIANIAFDLSLLIIAFTHWRIRCLFYFLLVFNRLHIFNGDFTLSILNQLSYIWYFKRRLPLFHAIAPQKYIRRQFTSSELHIKISKCVRSIYFAIRCDIPSVK